MFYRKYTTRRLDNTAGVSTCLEFSTLLAIRAYASSYERVKLHLATLPMAAQKLTLDQ